MARDWFRIFLFVDECVNYFRDRVCLKVMALVSVGVVDGDLLVMISSHWCPKS